MMATVRATAFDGRSRSVVIMQATPRADGRLARRAFAGRHRLLVELPGRRGNAIEFWVLPANSMLQEWACTSLQNRGEAMGSHPWCCPAVGVGLERNGRFRISRGPSSYPNPPPTPTADPCNTAPPVPRCQ
jgi:hypothetical protein